METLIVGAMVFGLVLGLGTLWWATSSAEKLNKKMAEEYERDRQKINELFRAEREDTK